VHTKRYEKQVPGHHIQVDVKFLTFAGKAGQKIRRFQYTAIDDATRVRALKLYAKHTQANAIDFVDHIIEKFPFRTQTIRTDRGHEFQAKFHWHVDLAQLRDRLLSIVSFLGHLRGFLSKLMISISLVQKHPLRSGEQVR
jgi:hypothetical protein